MSEITFFVQLLKVRKCHGEEIQRNCTHVKDDYWIFEGAPDSLSSEFEIVGEGIVGSLGGLSQKELLAVCDEDLGVQIP